MRQETNVSKEDLKLIHNTLVLSLVDIAASDNYSLLKKLSLTLTLVEKINSRFNPHSKKSIVKRTKYK